MLAKFDPATATTDDVVLLDWPQDPSLLSRTNWGAYVVSPLGKREAWSKPTVLLGSAGLNLAIAWQTRGGVGCTCLQPLALGLRDHELFSKPFAVDRSKTIRIPTPDDFKPEVAAAQIDVLPLVDDVSHFYRPGWCTYATDFSANPDVEYFCGGVNQKTITAAAVWRQGNLFHFGFEQNPAEMNETGRELLLNAIAYISRFSQDRPIARTPSPFAGRVAVSRSRIAERFDEWKLDWCHEWITDSFAPSVAKPLLDKNKPELIKWAKENALFLGPDDQGRFDFDDDLRTLQVPFDSPRFFDIVTGQLNGTSTEQLCGHRLAARYLPEMPTDTPRAAASWLAQNRPYLFASDVGDYRWYIDPLARKRKIPSSELRGSRRADVVNQQQHQDTMNESRSSISK